MSPLYFDSPPPLGMSPTNDCSNLPGMSPSAYYKTGSPVFYRSSPIESVSCIRGTLPKDLLEAASNGDELNVAILINLHRVDVHYKDSQGNSALYYAIKNGHLKVAEYLIWNGADIADKDQDGMSLLHIASKFGHTHIIHYLISEHHFDPCCLDCEKRTPFFMACIHGHLEVAQYLLKILLQYRTLENIITSTDVHGDTVIHTAYKMGHIEIERWLISGLNCDPNKIIVPGVMKRMPLHYAAKFGHVHIVKYLVGDCGCNPSCTEVNGATP